MKTRMALALGLSTLAGVAGAGQLAGQGTEPAAQATQKQVSRHAAVKQLVLKWGPSAARRQGVDIYRWADNMVPLFRSADLGNLNRALTAKSYTDMVVTMTGSKEIQMNKLPGGVAPMSLGSTTSDLVYTPLPSCLLLDTRVAGGIMTAGTIRHYKASGANFVSQGGSSTNCGIPAGINALVVTVQSVNATGRGYFRMWPYGTSMPAASVMSYGTTQNTQNNIVLGTTVGDTADFSVQSSAGSHLVVAVLGYFAAPVATALQCTNSASSASVTLDTTTRNRSVSSPACPAGYTRVATIPNLSGDFYLVSTVTPDNGGGTGFFHYAGSSSASVNIASRCCRVPGR